VIEGMFTHRFFFLHNERMKRASNYAEFCSRKRIWVTPTLLLLLKTMNDDDDDDDDDEKQTAFDSIPSNPIIKDLSLISLLAVFTLFAFLHHHHSTKSSFVVFAKKTCKVIKKREALLKPFES